MANFAAYKRQVACRLTRARCAGPGRANQQVRGDLRLRLLYRDVDRIPFLLAVQDAAHAHGLDLELVRHRQIGKEDWGEALKRGDVDAIAENYWALVRYRAAGDPFVTVASASHWWREYLLARPGLDTVHDLKGKRLAVRSTGPQPWFPAVFFAQAGMAGEVTFVTIPEAESGRFGLWKAVVSGDCDACFVSKLYAEPPLQARLHEIEYPPFPFTGGHVVPTTTEAFAYDNPDAVQALVDAMFDACERCVDDDGYMLELVRRGTGLLREYHTLSSEAEAVRTAAILREEIARVPIPTLRGIQNALDLVTVRFPELDGFDPLLMWDLSFARIALAKRTRNSRS
jgi:hypothetical protein